MPPNAVFQMKPCADAAPGHPGQSGIWGVRVIRDKSGSVRGTAVAVSRLSSRLALIQARLRFADRQPIVDAPEARNAVIR
jgi:hypothetical protein